MSTSQQVGSDNHKKGGRTASNKAKQAISKLSRGGTKNKQLENPQEPEEPLSVLGDASDIINKVHKEPKEKKEKSIRKQKNKISQPNIQTEEASINKVIEQGYDVVQVNNYQKSFGVDKDQEMKLSVGENDEAKHVKTCNNIKTAQVERPKRKGTKEEKQITSIGQALRMRNVGPVNTVQQEESSINVMPQNLDSSHMIKSKAEDVNYNANYEEKFKSASTIECTTSSSPQHDDSSKTTLGQTDTSQYALPEQPPQPNRKLLNSKKNNKNTDKEKHRSQSSKNSATNREVNKPVESNSSPLSFSGRYSWEEPGYGEGSGLAETLLDSDITKESQDWIALLKTLDNDWNYRVAVLKRIRIVLSRAISSGCNNVVELFSSASLRNSLIAQTTDLRSSLVKEAFQTIAIIAESLGAQPDFWYTVAIFLEKASLSSVVKTTKVIAVPAEECGKRIVTASPSEAVLPVLCSNIRFNPHPTAREKATGFLLEVLKRGFPLVRYSKEVMRLTEESNLLEASHVKEKNSQYNISELSNEDSGMKMVEAAIASAIGDSQGPTREAGLTCLSEMEKHWSDKAKDLVENLDPNLRRRALSSLSTNLSTVTKLKTASKPRKTIKELKAEAKQTLQSAPTSTSSFVEECLVDGIKKVDIGSEKQKKKTGGTKKANSDFTTKPLEPMTDQTRKLRSRDPSRMR